MSYDLMLIKVRAGESAAEIAFRDDDHGSPTTPADPEKEALKARIAKALVTYDPGLEIFRFDHAEIARIQKISVEQAQLRFRHIELNDDATGIQITLSDDSASVTVPYWHVGEKADAVFRKMFACAQIICREGGYVAFDPQVEEVIDPAASLDELVASYVGHVRQLKETYAPVVQTGRPWWKFW